MQTTIENRRKVIVESLRSDLKKRTRFKEGGASKSRVKKEQENTKARAQKMMKGRVAPFVMPTLV
jgi:hypothetical protein